MISEGHLPTLIDLIQQMRELKVNNNRSLQRSNHKIPFAKMISKYFSHGEKDIPIEKLPEITLSIKRTIYP